MIESWVELKNKFVIIQTKRFVRLANFPDCAYDERRKGYLGHGCNRNETISPRVGRKIHGCHGTSGTHVQSHVSFQRHVATRGESCRNVENWPMTIIARNFRTAYGSTPPHFFPKIFPAKLAPSQLSTILASHGFSSLILFSYENRELR